jgi:hypothetical protein
MEAGGFEPRQGIFISHCKITKYDKNLFSQPVKDSQNLSRAIRYLPEFPPQTLPYYYLENQSISTLSLALPACSLFCSHFAAAFS